MEDSFGGENTKEDVFRDTAGMRKKARIAVISFTDT